MTDRELLELAAKAAGIPGRFGERSPYDGYPEYSCGIGGGLWNPLTDDGDALRLAHKCRINIQYRDADLALVSFEKINATVSVWYGMDELRRAVVAVAAAIGESMP